MIERDELVAHPARQAVQHVGESDRREWRHVEVERRKQIGLAELRLEAREPPLGTCKAVPVDVEHDKTLEIGSTRAVEEITGAYASLEMIGREIGAIELKQLPCRAAPGEMVGQPMHQHIVDGEHGRRVDRMRFRDRLIVPPLGAAFRSVLGHALTYSFTITWRATV